MNAITTRAIAGHTNSILAAPMMPFVVGVTMWTTAIAPIASTMARRRTTVAVLGDHEPEAAAPTNSRIAKATSRAINGMSYGVGFPEPSMRELGSESNFIIPTHQGQLNAGVELSLGALE